MHVLEATIRPRDGNIQKTLEWWKSLIPLEGAFNKEGKALSKMDGENNVMIIRHTFDSLSEEQEFSERMNGSQAQEKIRKESSDYIEGPITFHRYNVLHSY
mgnify:FL=1